MRQKKIDGMLITKPTRTDVLGLMVGDLAPDCFGGMGRVASIYARGSTPHGKAFVCYYVTWGTDSRSRISESMTENEIVATIPLISRFRQIGLVPF